MKIIELCKNKRIIPAYSHCSSIDPSLQALFEVITSEASNLKSLNILINNFIESTALCNTLDSRDKHTLFSNAVAVRDVSSR